ncbi:MAG: tRNA (guanosine(37)-N1)-methyltransferase TrmD [Lachnospiraceae bacterium]|nr:tRNA (guanosine(37)-N1)-methyltransferase TrmD [Lachnospiraceae bacterium]MEE3461312.1 tRNA (guanosine(37)-N1)-methyltransferase TrmD [Lachnospiraceae bacterium]
MNFHVMTLFPELISTCMNESITGRAIRAGLISVDPVNIRDYTLDKHRNVDDYPFGGGAGMLMMADPVYRCYTAVLEKIGENSRVRTLYMSPEGKTFTQADARSLSEEDDLIFLCGHYEGIDARVLEEIRPEEYSIGDYVLTGGELPAIVMMDAISRLVPGVLNNPISSELESHSHGLLEYPQYTRPREWHGKEVPEVLLSGDHRRIKEWCLNKAIEVTRQKRPDMYEQYMSNEDR